MKMDDTGQNSEKSDSLTPKQRYCIAVMLASRSVTEGCKNAEISTSLWYKWLEQPVFKQAYETEQENLVSNAYRILETGLPAAALKLFKLVECDDLRLARLAAVDVLKLYSEHKEIAQIQKQLDEIMTRLDKAKI